MFRSQRVLQIAALVFAALPCSLSAGTFTFSFTAGQLTSAIAAKAGACAASTCEYNSILAEIEPPTLSGYTILPVITPVNWTGTTDTTPGFPEAVIWSSATDHLGNLSSTSVFSLQLTHASLTSASSVPFHFIFDGVDPSKTSKPSVQADLTITASPVPEPASYVGALGIGVSALLYLRVRSRRATTTS